MPIPNESSLPEGLIEFLAQSKNHRSYRWTMSEKSASKFKPYFDLFIQTGKQYEIIADKVGLSIRSLHIRINDALKWYSTNGTDTDKAKYLDMRNRIKFQQTDKGVAIRLASEPKLGINQSFQPLLEAMKWLETFKEWINSPSDKVFDSKKDCAGLVITDGVKNTVTQLCTELGLELYIDNESFRVAK